MNSAEPAYARTGAFRDSGIPGIPRAVAPQCKIIPNALARIFRRRSTIIATGLLALTAFAMLPVDNAEAQSGTLSLASPSNDASDNDLSVPITTGQSRQIHITLNNVATDTTPTVRLQFIGLGRRANVTTSGATFPDRNWTLTINGIVSGSNFRGVPARTGRFIESGKNRSFSGASARGMAFGDSSDCECTIMEWTLDGRVPAHGRIVFTLTPEFDATGTHVRPGLVTRQPTVDGGITLAGSNPSVRKDPANGFPGRIQFRYVPIPVVVASLAKINNVVDSVLRERSPYSNPSGTNNDTPGDTATVIMDLNHFPTPEGGGDPTAATIHFRIGNALDLPEGALAAIGPGPDNGTNDFRVSPTNNSNPAGLIWSAIDSSGNGTVQVKRSLIRGTGNNSRPPNPGRLGVPGAANTLNSSDRAQIRLRFEPYNNRDTDVETITFNITRVQVSGQDDVISDNIAHSTQLMTIQPSGQANVKLAEVDGTGANPILIHTDGESKRFAVELGGINPTTARTNGAANVRVNMLIEGTADRVFTRSADRIIETGDYSLTLPDDVNLPFDIISGNESRAEAASLSFTVPLSLFDENSGTDMDAGEETFIFTVTARTDDIRQNTQRTITFRLDPDAKAELVTAGRRRIGALIPETSDSTDTVLTYSTRRRNHIASLSGGGVDLHALGTNDNTNSGTFTLLIEHYNHAISAPEDYIYVRMDMVPTGSPVGLDTPSPTKFVNSGDTRMITSGDYTVSIPNNTSGVQIIPLTNEEAAFRLRIPLARFLANDTEHGTIATRGAEEVIMTVRANDVDPTRRQTTTFSINNVVEFDESLLPGSPFVRGTTFLRATGNDPGNFGNDEVTFNLLLPEGLQSWITDGPVEEVTEGRTVRLTTGSVVDESFHVGTLYVTGARRGGYALITLTGTVPSGELTIGPGVEFNVNLSLLRPADGSRNNRRDNFSRHQEALRARQSGFTNSGSTATKTVCLTLSADGNATREFWVARRNGEFPQPDMDVTLAVTDVVALPGSCTFPAGDAPSTDSIGTSEFTMRDDGDLGRYLRVDFLPRGSGVTMPEMEEGNQFERPLRIGVTPLQTQIDTLDLPMVRYKLHARVESGGLTANNTGVGDRPPTATDPLADFTLLISGDTSRTSLVPDDIIPFTGFGNELVAEICHSTGVSERYNEQVWILPRAANSIADGDKIITFSISDLFFPNAPGDGNALSRCHPDRTIDSRNAKVPSSQTYPFLAGPTIAIRDGPLIPAFTDGDPSINFNGEPSSAAATFDTITLNLDYEEHIKSHVVQNPGVNLAGVTHFVYVNSSNTTTVKRCRVGGNGTNVADNTEILIADLGLDCTKATSNGKGFVVEGTDRTAESSTRSIINFKLRNRKNIGPQSVRTSVDSVPATLNFVDALSFNPGIRKLTVGSQVFESLPTEEPFAITATLQPEVHEPSVRVVPADHHSTVEIAGTAVSVAETPSDADERSAARNVTVTSGTPFDIKVTTERSTEEVPITRTYSVTPIILASRNDDPRIRSITATVGGRTFNIDLDHVTSTGTVTLPAATRTGDSVTIAVLPEEDRVGGVDISRIVVAPAEPRYTTAALEGGNYVDHINGFSTGDAIFNVQVTTDEGTLRVYAITVTVPSTDEEINTLTVDGFPVSLDDGTSTGSVTIRDGTRVAVISARAAHARATITAISGPDGAETVTSFITVPQNDDNPPFTTFTADVSGLTVGTNEFTITVIPEDTIDPQNPTYTDSAARIYTITVIVPPNGASLSSLLVGGRRLTLTADNPFEADVNLGPDPDTTDVKATAINGTNCTIEANVAINPPCTTITIGRTDSAETEIDASVRVDSGSNYPLSSPVDGQIINIVVTNISAANVTSTRRYKINLIVPGGDDADNSFRRITVANRNVSSDSTTSSSNSVVVAGGLTSAEVVVTPTQPGAIVTAITGCQGSDCSAEGAVALTGGFTGNNDVTKRSATLSGFLLDRNRVSVIIRSTNGDIATHHIRVTVPFSPPHDDSLANTGGLTVNGAAVILDHGQSGTTNTATGTIDLPTGTRRATVIATPSQVGGGASGAFIRSITGTDSGLDSTGTRRTPEALDSDQDQDINNSTRGPRTVNLTGLTPDNTANNTIVVVVRSPNGLRDRTYTIAVTIPAALSENTLLSTVTLTTSAGVENVDLDLSAGTGTAELPVGTEEATLAVTLADQLSTVSDISGTNADDDDLTGTGLGSNTVAGNRSGTRSVTISNLATGEDNIIMITVRAQTGAMRTYAIRAEIDPVPTGVLTPASPLNLGNNTANAGTFSLALTGIPSTVNDGANDVPLTAVDVFFAFGIAGTGADTTLGAIDDDGSTSVVETNDFSLTADGGARFFPARAIAGGEGEGFVLRVPGTRFAEGAGSPTTHSAETITFTVTTKNITPASNLTPPNDPYSIRFANSHVAWRTAAGAITALGLEGPDVSNFSRLAVVVFDIASTLSDRAELGLLAIAPEPLPGRNPTNVDLDNIFETTRTTYSTRNPLPLGTTAVRITADPNLGGTVVINGCQGSDCSAQGAIALTVNGNTVSGLTPGDNTINVVVTSENRTNHQTYTITARVEGFNRATRINRASFAVAGNPDAQVTLTDGPLESNGSGTVEIANTTTATISVVPLTTNAIVTNITGCQGSDCSAQGAVALTGELTDNNNVNVNDATLTGFTTGANQIIVTVRHPTEQTNIRTYTIAVTVRPAPTAAITTIGGASHTFEEGAGTLVRVADFAVDMGAIHAGKCLSATINASSTSSITGSDTDGNGGDFVFYIVDQSVLGGGSAPGDAVPQGFGDGSENARTNGMSIILDSNGRGSRSFYVGPRIDNSTIDGDKLIDFGITDPKVHVTGCSGFLNPGTPNARTPDGSDNIPETGTIIASTALAVSGDFMIISADDESRNNPSGATGGPASITAFNDVTIQEGTIGNVEITFDAPVPPGRSVAYTLTPLTTNNKAASSADYTATSTVTLTPVSGRPHTYTFPVATTPDRIIENNEEATLTITNVIWTGSGGGNYAPPAPPAPSPDPNRAATLTITDSAVATDFVVSFVGDSNGDENGVNISTTLQGVASADVTLERNIDVLVASGGAGDTATIVDSDYTALDGTTGVVTFLASEHRTAALTSTQTIAIDPTGDTVVEPNETLTLTVSTTDTAATASDTATVTINNDDELTGVRFSATPGTSVGENAGIVTYTVSATGAVAAGLDVVVPFTVDGTATSGTDYTTIPTPLEVRFDSTNLSRDINITIINDGDVEVPETLIIALSNPEPESLYALGTPNSHELTINSEDTSNTAINVTGGMEAGLSAGSFEIDFGNFPSGETADVDYEIRSTNGSALNTNYTLSNGTGITGRDTSTITMNQRSGILTVTPVNDADIYDELLTLTIREVRFSGGHVIPPGMTSAPLTLTDDDPLTVAFASSSPRIAEANGTGVTLTLGGGTVIDSRGKPKVTITPTAGTAGTPATAATDFPVAAIEMEIFAANRTTGSIDVTIPVVSDAIVEDDETIRLALSLPAQTSGVRVSTTGSTFVTGTIVNDDELTNVHFSTTPAAAVNEDAVTVTYIVSATGVLERTVEIPFTVTDGTTTLGADYTVRPNSPLVLSARTNPTATISIDITNDGDVEVPETLTVALSDPESESLYALGTPNSHELTINSEDTSNINIIVDGGREAGLSPGSFEIVLDNFPSGETADVRYTLASTNGSTLTTNYTLSEGTGITGRDTSTITMNQRSGTLMVTPVNDADIYDELLTLTISEVRFSGGYTIPSSMTSTPLRITDDDELTVGFELAESTLGEDDGMGVTLTVGGGTVIDDRGVPTVTVTPTAGGTDPATAGDDYATVGIRVPITAAARTATTNDVTIPILLRDMIIGDMAVETDETVILTLTTTEQHEADISITGLAATTTTIMDVPPALTVALTAPATIAENEGPLIGTLTATAVGGGSFTLERAVKVRVFTTAETATAGSDFTEILDGHRSGDVNIGPDTTAASRFTATTEITIIDDTVAEALEEETFTLTLAEASPSDRAVTALGVSTARVTITDDDRAMGFGTIAANPSSIAEGATTTVTVNLTGALPPGSVSFDYAITGTGADGVEPDQSGNQRDIIAEEIGINPTFIATDRMSFRFTVTARSDNAIENTETARVTVSNVSAGDLDIAGDMNGTFTITDVVAANAFVVSFDTDTVAGISGRENDGAITATLQGVAASNVTLERDVLVQVSSADGTATIADSDYTDLDNTTGIVRFPDIVNFPNPYSTAGATGTRPITIIPTGDAVVEPNETLELTVQQTATNTDTAATIDTNNDIATVTIVNDDTITNVRFTAERSTFAEDTGRHNNITVVADGAIASGYSVRVAFTVGNETGAATPGTDYDAITDLLVTLGPSLSQTIPVAIIDNPMDVEPDETVTLTLMVGGPDAALYALSTISTEIQHTLTIIDDNTISVEFDETGSAEDEDAVTRTRTITVNIVGNATIVDGHSENILYTLEGDAILNTDYTVSPASPLTLNAGDTSVDITITIIPDDIVEPDEDIVLILSDSPHSTANPRPYEVGTNRRHTHEITNSDTISVGFAETMSDVTEGNTLATIAVEATGDIAADHSVVVDFTDSGGTALSGTDYDTIAPLTVTFRRGALSQNISVMVTEDSDAEPNETIDLTLTDSGTDNDYALIGITEHTFTINDNDALMVQFAAPTSMEEEGNGNVTHNIVVSYTGAIPVGDEVKVTFEVSGGTATAADYNIATSMVTFDSTRSSQNISVTILPDNIVEPNETIELTLTDGGRDMDLYNPVGRTEHEFTITDPDTIDVQFMAAESSMAESVSPRNIIVEASGTIAANHPGVDVPFTRTGGNATPGTDFTTISPVSMVTFGPGETRKIISVTITDDDIEEMDETIILTLTAPVTLPPQDADDYRLGTNTEHTLTIENASDDDSLMSLTVDGVDVIGLSEGDGTTGSVRLRYAIMHVPVVATATDDGATILSIAGRQDFSTNDGHTATLMGVFVRDGIELTVEVQAENRDTPRRTYTIEVSVPDTPRDTSQLRPMVTVSPTTRTIPETNGEVTIVVRLNRPVSTPVSLPFTITATDADADDYAIGFPPNCDDCDEVMGGDLVFSANQQRREITFAATTDFEPEDDQVILFKLDSGTRGAGAGAVIVPITAESTITIRDDDTPPTEVSVSASRTRVREDAGTSVITVSLDSAAITGAPITLPFSFSDDSATFGDNADDPDADYFATCPGATDEADPMACSASASLVFMPGQRTKTITVTGIDDTPEDPEEEDTEEDETILFKLASGLRGTVTVASADEVTLTLATNVTDTMETMRDVEVVTSLTGIKQVGMITGLIRQRFSDTVPAPSFGDIGSGTSGSGSTLNANAIADDPDFGAPSFSMDLPDNPENLGDLLNGFGFNTQARADAGGIWSMWVRGQYTSLDGSTTQENPAEDINPTLSYDGSATGVGLGMEWAGETTIIGIAADYITTVLDISTTSENITLSKYKETILLAAPYFALRRAKSHSFWMSLGVGTGTANATLDGTTRSADVKAGFANAGIDITVGGDAHEFVAGLSGSAIRKETDPFTFDNAVIPKVTTDSFQARGDITYAHTIGVGGGSMRPYIGLSTIHDFGDTPSDDEHALGLRSGITFSGLNLDLNLEGSSEFLRDDHKQWTISGNARFHSNPDNSGLSLSLDGSRGGDVGAGIEGSYGLPIRRFHPDAMLTPFAALRREDDGNEVVSGMRFSIGDDLDIDLQNTRRPHDDNETAVNLRFHREF